VISLGNTNLEERDLDTIPLRQICHRLNIEAGWPQFNVHFYDRLKKNYKKAKKSVLNRLMHDAVLNIPSDIEAFLCIEGYNPPNPPLQKEVQRGRDQQLMQFVAEKTMILKSQLGSCKELEGKEVDQIRLLIDNLIQDKKVADWNTDSARLLL